MFNLLDESFKQLPRSVDCIRIHTSGDFFSERYFLSWVKLATKYSNVLFYAYTKSIPYWVNNLDKIPDNMVLTASYGSTRDDLIREYNLSNVKVFKSIEDIDKANLPLDTNETNAINGTKEFALLIHGTQPKKEKV